MLYSVHNLEIAWLFPCCIGSSQIFYQEYCIGECMFLILWNQEAYDVRLLGLSGDPCFYSIGTFISSFNQWVVCWIVLWNRVNPVSLPPSFHPVLWHTLTVVWINSYIDNNLHQSNSLSGLSLFQYAFLKTVFHVYGLLFYSCPYFFRLLILFLGTVEFFVLYRFWQLHM